MKVNGKINNHKDLEVVILNIIIATCLIQFISIKEVLLIKENGIRINKMIKMGWRYGQIIVNIQKILKMV